MSHLDAHLLLENCLHVAIELGFSASWFSEHCAADVTGDFVNSVTEYELFIATFWTFNAQENCCLVSG